MAKNNSVGIRGFLVADPEFKDVNGTKVCSIAVSVEHSYKPKEGGDWKKGKDGIYNVELWGAASDPIKDTKKGSFVAVKGVLEKNKNFINIKGFESITCDAKEAHQKLGAKEWPNNSVTISGLLGKDVEIKEVGGKKLANVSIAVSADYKDKATGEWISKDPNWITVTAWDERAAALEGAKAGDKFEIKGSLHVTENPTPEKTWYNFGVSAASVKKVEKKSPGKEVKEPGRSM